MASEPRPLAAEHAGMPRGALLRRDTPLPEAFGYLTPHAAAGLYKESIPEHEVGTRVPGRVPISWSSKDMLRCHDTVQLGRDRWIRDKIEFLHINLCTTRTLFSGNIKILPLESCM